MKSVSANGICRSLLAGALLSIGVGCADDGEDRGAASEVPEGVNGELVYALDVGPGHTVQFLDFDQGERVAAYESMPVGAKSLLDDVGKPEQSLAAVFSKLRPGLSVPSRILAADQRMVEKRSLRQAITPPAGWVTAEPAAKDSLLDKTGAGISSAAATCSADLFADGWGGRWFQDNHCLGRCDQLFSTCVANWGWTHYSAAASDYFKYRQMEGDFAVAGQVEAYTTGYPYPTPKHWWTKAVAPRTISTWYFSGSGVSWQTNHFAGESPCGHLHHTKQICD